MYIYIYIYIYTYIYIYIYINLLCHIQKVQKSQNVYIKNKKFISLRVIFGFL